METRRLRLVCIFFFFVGRRDETHCAYTNPPAIGTRTVSAGHQSSSGSSRPSLGRFPAAVTSCNATTNGHVQSSGGDDDDDVPLLSASVTERLRPARWQDTSGALSSLTRVFAYSEDTLAQENAIVKGVYVDTLILLLRRAHEWLTGDEELDAVGYYLGYDEETVALINRAMTELYAAKRNAAKDRTMDSLEAFFYYSCDIGRMGEEDKNAVKRNLDKFVRLFALKMEVVSELDEAELKNDLTTHLNLLLRKTSDSFNVSVRSMKMRILSDASQDEVVNSIRNRSVLLSVEADESVEKLVESYATETDGDKVNAYHVNVLGVLIPDVFGYAYNHFELLYELEDIDIDESDKKTIEKFSPFMNSFMSIFLYRFFEFKGQLSTELMYVMNSVRHFLCPSEGSNADHSVKSIRNYYRKSERIEVIEEHMKITMEMAVEITLSSCTGESFKNWKAARISKIAYTKNGNDKSTLIRLIEENREKAFRVLDMFKRELSNTK